MPDSEKRHLELFVVDIIVAIKKIKIYTSNFKSGAELKKSHLHWDATNRQFELIGEALNNLLNDEAFKNLAPEYFRKVVNFRNAVIHGYFGVAPEEVWNIATEKLDALQNDLVKISAELFDLTMAIDSTVTEYAELEDQDMVDYLTACCKSLI